MDDQERKKKTTAIKDDLLRRDEDDNDEDEGDNDEGATCRATHQCHSGHIVGQCILENGHAGDHQCGWCTAFF
jgi:hypothetical protein